MSRYRKRLSKTAAAAGLVVSRPSLRVVKRARQINLGKHALSLILLYTYRRVTCAAVV